MNYYGIWISFSDDSNRFYDPARRNFFAFPVGEPMPGHWFIREFDIERHKRIVEKLVDGFCMDHAAALHLSEIRPGDPDYQSIARAMAVHTETQGGTNAF